MSILETHALSRRFGEMTAVSDLTLSVEVGEIFGLVGPNGAGKTTAIKMLTTLLPRTSGTARVAGFDLIRQAANVRRIRAMVSNRCRVSAFELHITNSTANKTTINRIEGWRNHHDDADLHA